MTIKASLSSGFHNWDEVETAVARLATENRGDFDPAIVLNAQDLCRAVSQTCPLPAGIGKGYWNTVIIWWKGLEVEICEDHYEVYQFMQGETRIQHFDREPEADVDRDLVSQLSRVITLPG